MMDWKILKVGDKYEVHNEFGYWTEFDSYADASCWVKDKNEEFKRDCERARKHKNEI